jgi:hypothetical protein
MPPALKCSITPDSNGRGRSSSRCPTTRPGARSCWPRARSAGLRIIARASTGGGARRLRDAGANHVVRPELEGGIEIVRRTLLDLDLPGEDVGRYVDLIRQEELAEADQLSAAREQLLRELQPTKTTSEVVSSQNE